MMQPATVTATVVPEWGNYRDAEGERCLKGAKVAAITQQRPRAPKGGTVLVKLSIQLPAGAFLPLRPVAVVVVPDSMTVTTPVEVTAEDPE